MWNEQNLVCKKEQIKCNNIKKQYIIDYITKEYRKKNIIQMASKFLIISTENLQLKTQDLEKQIHYLI